MLRNVLDICNIQTDKEKKIALLPAQEDNDSVSDGTLSIDANKRSQVKKKHQLNAMRRNQNADEWPLVTRSGRAVKKKVIHDA